jgi:hypothetical protein
MRLKQQFWKMAMYPFVNFLDSILVQDDWKVQPRLQQDNCRFGVEVLEEIQVSGVSPCLQLQMMTE